MDPRLAEIYGTNEDVSDVEKTAAAELAEKLAEEGEMDIDDMSNDDIEALAQEVLSSDEETDSAEDDSEEKTASDDTEESEEASDETEEKLAEADYIGRVMAHAYVQELKSIDKTAGERFEKAKAKVKDFGAKAKEKATAFGGKVKERAAKAGAHVKANKRAYGIGVGATALAAGGAAAYRHSKKKHSSELSALDTLAQQRALEILEASGIDPGEKQAESEDASKWDVLGDAVEARAMEMLKAEGYEFEDSEE